MKVPSTMPLRQSLHVLCSLVIALGVVPSVANAVDPSTDQGSSLEEVVVTARKRAESIIEVPESITAFGAVAIQDFNIQKF